MLRWVYGLQQVHEMLAGSHAGQELNYLLSVTAEAAPSSASDAHAPHRRQTVDGAEWHVTNSHHKSVAAMQADSHMKHVDACEAPSSAANKTQLPFYSCLQLHLGQWRQRSAWQVPHTRPPNPLLRCLLHHVCITSSTSLAPAHALVTPFPTAEAATTHQTFQRSRDIHTSPASCTTQSQTLQLLCVERVAGHTVSGGAGGEGGGMRQEPHAGADGGDGGDA
jgi:hypothetical protein